MNSTQPVALVTGASSGIGKAASLALVEAGFEVVGTSRNTSGITDRNGVTFLDLDVTSDESVSALVRRVIEQFGRIDVLVNNAGTGAAGAAEESSVTQDQRVFDINFFGLIRMTKAVLPHMRARGSGRIINISSVLGLVPATVHGQLRGDQARDRGLLGVGGPRGARARRSGAPRRARLHKDRFRHERPAARRAVADLCGAAARFRRRDGHLRWRVATIRPPSPRRSSRQRPTRSPSCATPRARRPDASAPCAASFPPGRSTGRSES